MNHQIFRQSPLIGAITGPTQTVGEWHIARAGLDGFRVGSSGVTLWDWSNRTKVIAEGAGAANIERKIAEGDELEIGAGRPIGLNSFAYRLRHDQIYFDGPAEKEGELMALCEGAAADADTPMAVFNVTDGRFLIGIGGDSCREVLSCVCGLDFSEGAFPNHAARQTQMAKIRQLVIRRDLDDSPMFLLSGGRSLAVYLWKVLVTTPSP